MERSSIVNYQTKIYSNHLHSLITVIVVDIVIIIMETEAKERGC